MPCIPRSSFGMRIPGSIADGHLEYQAATARRIWEIRTMVQFRGTSVDPDPSTAGTNPFVPASHPSGSSTSTTVPLRDPLYPGSTHGAPYLAAGHQTLPSELQVLSSSSCRMTSRQPASSGLPSRPGYLLRMDLASRLLGAPQLVWRNEFPDPGSPGSLPRQQFRNSLPRAYAYDRDA